MKWFFKRSKRQAGKHKPKPAPGQRNGPLRHGKEAGWAQLDHQEAIAYWAKSQGAR